MNRLIPVSTPDGIATEYQNTPIGLLLEYHNLNRPLDIYTQAHLLIGMCMDNRKRLRIPDSFAYIIRSGGGNLRHSEFKVSYAIAIGGVSSIALIGHNDCGMVGLAAKKEKFVSGLVEKTGWEKDKAEEHFMRFAPIFEIEDEIDFVLSEAMRLRLQYPGIQVAPILYRVEDDLLYMVREQEKS
ncbi:MAG: carbonic anhydrase [Anaerolineae bacterium]|nr:carbonic anhydrase [Anaerolineae bacterium]